MKLFGKVLIFSSFFMTQVLMAQDSPLSAAPGQPPPPQGWNASAPEDAGIHPPHKKKKSPYKIRMQSVDGQKVNTPPLSSPAPTEK